MKNQILLLMFLLLFFQCNSSSKNNNNLQENHNKRYNNTESSYEKIKTAIKSKDTIIVKLENLKVIVEVDEDEKEDFNIEYNELIGLNKAGKVYEKRDTIRINSEYNDMTGISNLNNKKLIIKGIDNVKELNVTFSYSIGIGYAFDALNDEVPALINEYIYIIKESIILDLLQSNELIVKSEKDYEFKIMEKYFNEIKQKIYTNKKELYSKLMNDKSSTYYKDEYYRNSMQAFLNKKESDFNSLKELDAFIQVADVVIQFKGKTKDGKEFTEYLGG